MIDEGKWKAAFEEFLDRPGSWDWLVPWAKQARCLPLY